jgi:hypothetical protein
MLHVCFINDMTYYKIALLVPSLIPDASARRRHRALMESRNSLSPSLQLSTPLSMLFCCRAIPRIPLSLSQSSSSSEFNSCAWLLSLGPFSFSDHQYSLDPFSFPCANESQPHLLLISQPKSHPGPACNTFHRHSQFVITVTLIQVDIDVIYVPSPGPLLTFTSEQRCIFSPGHEALVESEARYSRVGSRARQYT